MMYYHRKLFMKTQKNFEKESRKKHFDYIIYFLLLN